MTAALVTFLVLSAISSLFGIWATASDRNLVPAGRILFVSLKSLMLVWAVVLAVLVIVK